MRNANRLTAVGVAKLNRPGRYADGGGLYLQISKWRTKAWLFRFDRGSRERQMGLGPADIVSLADARERARAARLVLLDGGDPIEVRRAERHAQIVAAASGLTFSQCADAYIKAHAPSWKNPKHRQQWESTLATYAGPVFGDLPVGAVDTALVLKAIEPIWYDRTETAGRLRGRIEKVLDWARARGYRNGENPARWQGHLGQLLPRKSKITRTRHHPALPYRDLPRFMARLREQNGVSALALEFTILTAARTGAVIGGTLDEIDFKTKIWTVPPERTGTKIVGDEARRVPLSARAVAIVRSIKRRADERFLFPGRQPGSPLSNMAMLELMRDLAPGYVPHGFRSTFKDWAAEITSFPNEVSEAALWHTVTDETEAAYRRGDLMQKRRSLMDEWARYCAVAGKRSRGS